VNVLLLLVTAWSSRNVKNGNGKLFGGRNVLRMLEWKFDGFLRFILRKNLIVSSMVLLEEMNNFSLMG